MHGRLLGSVCFISNKCRRHSSEVRQHQVLHRLQTVTRLDNSIGVVVFVKVLQALWLCDCLKVGAFRIRWCSGMPCVILQGCISTTGAYKATQQSSVSAGIYKP